MKDNHNNVLVSAIHQHGSAICSLPLEHPAHFPPHPSPLLKICNYEETLVVWEEKKKFVKHKVIYCHSFIKLIFGKQSSGVSDGLTKDYKVIETANCSQVLERGHLMPPGATQRDGRRVQTERVAGPGAYAFVMICR